MFPWLWFWSPHLQYPLSGSVEQDYKPFTNWGALLFGSIKPEAGNGQIEQKTFTDVASYGKQIGLITELIMVLVEKEAPDWLNGLKKLEELKEPEKSKKLKELEKEEELKRSESSDPLIPSNPLIPLERLRKIQKDIEEIKKQDLEAKIDDIETVVKKIQSRGDRESRKIIARLSELLKDGA